MRITTRMLNESARKAGLPVNNTSLLNYINNKGKGNTLLDALNKKKETTANLKQKSSYEKLDKEADKLSQTTEVFLKDGENSFLTRLRQVVIIKRCMIILKSFLKIITAH